jgi:hypothetical protein
MGKPFGCTCMGKPFGCKSILLPAMVQPGEGLRELGHFVLPEICFFCQELTTPWQAERQMRKTVLAYIYVQTLHGIVSFYIIAALYMQDLTPERAKEKCQRRTD